MPTNVFRDRRRSARLGIEAITGGRRGDLRLLLERGIAEIEDLAAMDRGLAGHENQQVAGFRDLAVGILLDRRQAYHLVGGDEGALDFLHGFAALAAMMMALGCGLGKRKDARAGRMPESIGT